MRRRLDFASFALALAILITAGCADGDPSTREPQTLTIFLPSADERSLGPSKFNPWFLVLLPNAISLEGEESNSVSMPEDPTPRLIDRWAHSPDYREWTGHVRQGVRWGDGRPVTADDVKFSLELWTDTVVWYDDRLFEQVRVVDDSTVHVVFEEPVSQTPHSFNWLAMLPKHLLDTLDLRDLFNWTYWVQPVGNGPYRYVRHVPQTMTELAVNPDYYGDPPRIATVVLRYGGNPMTELLAGTVDVVETVTPVEAERLRGDSRFEVYHRVSHSRSYVIQWNHRNPLFQDASVRRALTMAIDRQELHQLLGLPRGIAVVDVPTLGRHHRAGSVPPPMPYVPERAARILADAGWIDTDADGALEKDGLEFRFTLTGTKNESAQAVYLQEQFGRIGVRVDVEVLQRGTGLLAQKLNRTFEYDAVIVRSNYILGYGIYGSEPFRSSGYRHPVMSALADSAARTLDNDQHDEYMQALWQLVGEEAPSTYLHPQVAYLAAHRRVRGLRHNMEFFANVEHLWIEDE